MTFEEIKKRLNELGVMTFGNKRMFKKLAEIIDQDEQIITAIDGLSDDDSGDFMLLVSTDKRIFVLRQGVFSGKGLEEVDLDSISEIKSAKKFNNSCIQIFNGSVKTEITKVSGSRVEEVTQTLKNQIREVQKTETTNIVDSPSTPHVTDEIRKYKELMDEGIITEDEFNAKKEQLLGL